jgi:hypothetical protein
MTSSPLNLVPNRRRFKRDPLRARQRGGFRTADLNVVGWSALVGAGLVLGVLVAVVFRTGFRIALPAGVLVVWLVLLALDERRWRNSMIGLGNEALTPESGAAIVAKLRTMGIEATYEEVDYSDEVDDEELQDDDDLHADRDYIQRSIRCRNADAKRVQEVMARHLGS